MDLRRRTFDARRAAAIALGLLLWLQLAAGTLGRELGYADVETRRVVIYLTPLLLLIGVALFRHVVVDLLLFPASFGWVLVVAPRDQTSEALGRPGAFLFVALTLVGYALAASAWLRAPLDAPYLDIQREPIRATDQRWNAYRGTFAPRMALLVAIFLVSAAMVPLAQPVARDIAEAFGTRSAPDSVDNAIIFCNLIMFFAWTVVAFTLFFRSSLGQEASAHHLETQMQATLARAKRTGLRTTLRLALLTALAVGFSILLWRLR